MAKTAKTSADRLAEVRDRIADLEHERDQLNKAPCTRDEALTALDSWIAGRAAEFEKDTGVNGLLRGDPNVQLHVVSFGSGEKSWTPALCALMPDAVRSHFAGRIDAALADKTPMTPAQRQQRKADIDGELYELNAEEERLVQIMHGNGEGVTRRGDADPRAVLGLDAPPAAPEPPPAHHPKPWTYRDAAGRQITHHRLPQEARAADRGEE